MTELKNKEYIELDKIGEEFELDGYSISGAKIRHAARKLQMMENYIVELEGDMDEAVDEN